MGSWQGDDLTKVPIPEDLTQCNTEQRRAYIFERIKEEGHPSLIDTNKLSRKCDVSRRQIYYDIDAITEFIEAMLDEFNHVGRNFTVFEKAKREALNEGEWKAAVEILEKEAQWLENRGALEKPVEQHEITWRSFIEDEV